VVRITTRGTGETITTEEFDPGEDAEPAHGVGGEAGRSVGDRSSARRETAPAPPGDNARAVGGFRVNFSGEGAG
jgi:hypothetical protein